MFFACIPNTYPAFLPLVFFYSLDASSASAENQRRSLLFLYHQDLLLDFLCFHLKFVLYAKLHWELGESFRPRRCEILTPAGRGDSTRFSSARCIRMFPISSRA